MTFSCIKSLSKRVLVFVSALALGACASYEVSLNDQVLYTPPPLFSDYRIADPALKECVASTIRELKITDANALESLFCPDGNIQSLAGLEQFQAIKKLGLSRNKVNSLDIIGLLKNLEQVDLSFNHISKIEDLEVIKNLSYLNLKGNPIISCGSLESGPSLLLPEGC